VNGTSGVNGTGGGTALIYGQVKLLNNTTYTNTNPGYYGSMQIPFDSVDYDPSPRWDTQVKGFEILRGEVFEIGATVTTYSWVGNSAILHIVDLTNNQVIKSVMSHSAATTDYEVSISIDCIYVNGTDNNIRVGIFLEGTGASWTVTADYGPSLAHQPNKTSTNLTYFWMHKIA
jgi:hypothetical protein